MRMAKPESETVLPSVPLPGPLRLRAYQSMHLGLPQSLHFVCLLSLLLFSCLFARAAEVSYQKNLEQGPTRPAPSVVATLPENTVEALLPPSYVRVRLVPAAPGAGKGRTALRIFWTRSPSTRLDGYRVTLMSPQAGDALQQLDVSDEHTWVDFFPRAVTVPLPQVQVQSLIRAKNGSPEQLSEPVKTVASPHHLEPVVLELTGVRPVSSLWAGSSPASLPGQVPEPNAPLAVPFGPPKNEQNQVQVGKYALFDTQKSMLLPAGSILSVAQDERSGMVWVGTDGGGLGALDPETGRVEILTSLDGLPGDSISGLAVQRGPEGSTLWAMTDGGLARVEAIPPDPQVDAYALSRDAHGLPVLVQGSQGAILQDRSGRVLLGTQTDGLMIFEPGSASVQQLTVADGLSSDTLHELIVLPERPGTPGSSGLLLLTRDGLQLLKADAGKYEVVGGRSFQGAPAGPIQALAVTPDGQPLILSSQGLLRLSRTGGNAEQLWAFARNEVPIPGGLKVTSSGHVVMATEVGLRILALPTGKELVAHALSLPPPDLPEVVELNTGKSSIPGRGRQDSRLPHPLDPFTQTRIASLTLGTGSVVWIGLKDSLGLIRYDYRSGDLRHYRASPLLLHGRVSALARDASGQVWAGTELGPARLQRGWILPGVEPQSAETFQTVLEGQQSVKEPLEPGLPLPPVLAPLAQSLLPNAMPLHRIFSLFADGTGIVLLGQACERPGVGWNAGGPGCITRFDPLRGFEPFLPSDISLGGMDEVTAMLVHQGDLFVGTGRGGMRVFLPNTGEELIEHPILRWKPWLTERRILALAALDNTLWVGTREGLLRMPLEPGDPQSKAPSRLDLLPPELPAPLASLSINALLIDSAQTLWVATERGLWRCVRLNRDEACQMAFSGSIDRPALSLTLDAQHRLWVGTTQGLYRTASLDDGPDALSEEPVKFLPDKRIDALLVEEDGVAWVGTDRGLLLLPPLEPMPPLTSGLSTNLIVVLLGLALALVLLFWYALPRRRDPVGESLMQDPELLLKQPLYTLSEIVVPLKSANRLSSILLRIELDSGRFDRVVGLAGHWPREDQVATREQTEALVIRLAPFLGAEMLPAHAFRRRHEVELAEQGGGTTQDGVLADTGAVPILHPPSPEGQQPEGYDVGAPGIEEWKGDSVADSGETPPPVTTTGTRSPAPAPPALTRGRDNSQSKAGPGAYAPSGKTSLSGLTVVEDVEPLLFVLRLPDLPIRLVQREVPMVVVRSRLPDEHPSTQISRMLRGLSLSSRYVLVLNLVAGWSLPTLSLPGTRFIPLNEGDLRRILYARDLERALVRHIMNHVKLTEVSPYSSKGEVTNPSMFVGRRFELDKIISSEKANFLIVGARQIGKSSLMGALKRYFKNEANRQIFSLTLSLQEDARSFYRRIALLLNKDRVPKDSNGFAEMLEMHHREHPVPALFLIDEVDGLLARERQQGYPVLTAMRRLQQQDTCWFILAGYWELVRLGNDYHSPLYNMSEVIELGALKSDEARDLILKPLHKMALGFDNHLIVDEMVAMTAGQPHLIQFICNQLLERMNARRQPLFSRSDWEAVVESDELKTYVTRNFKSNAGLLEEVVVYATLQYERFSHAMLETALETLGLKITLRAREESLRKLKLVGILKEVEGEFQFALPIFRRVMLKEDTMWFARVRAREMQEGSGS